ncbi:MAG: SulP family inorganic anion transporter [Myxococcota bacterium]
MVEGRPFADDAIATEQTPVSFSLRATWSQDLVAGLIVFLVALPLCIGIAHASQAPLVSGIIAGICGALVVPLISAAPLSVTGPAAGLTAIVLFGIDELGSFEAFLLATAMAGLIQVAFGLLRAGRLGSFVPSSVIRGMLAAVGLILIMKQIPHALGYDLEDFGAESFVSPAGSNTISWLLDALSHAEPGAVLVSLASIVVLAVGRLSGVDRRVFVSGPLAVVVIAILCNEGLAIWAPELYLGPSHRVAMPVVNNYRDLLVAPDLRALLNPALLSVAVTLALVSSIETLLNVEAVDKRDPHRRVTPRDRELIAQGFGNCVCGILGGLPVASVVVRSTVNTEAGAQSKRATIVHGVFLLIAITLAPHLLSLIPLASLAIILIAVGYQLASPQLFRTMYRQGLDRFAPFLVTVLAILFTDLLVGVMIGLVLGSVTTLAQDTHQRFSVMRDGDDYYVLLNQNLSFVHRNAFRDALYRIPNGSYVVVDGERVTYVDYDMSEALQDFLIHAEECQIDVEVRGALIGNLAEERAFVDPDEIQEVVFEDRSEEGLPNGAYHSRRTQR